MNQQLANNNLQLANNNLPIQNAGYYFIGLSTISLLKYLKNNPFHSITQKPNTHTLNLPPYPYIAIERKTTKATHLIKLYLEKYILNKNDRLLKFTGPLSTTFFNNIKLEEDTLLYKDIPIFHIETGYAKENKNFFKKDLKAVLAENRKSFYSQYQPLSSEPNLVQYLTVKLKLEDNIENNFLLERLFPIQSQTRFNAYELDYANLMLKDLIPVYASNKLLAKNEIELIRSWRETYTKFKSMGKLIENIANAYYTTKSGTDNFIKEILKIFGLVNTSITLVINKIDGKSNEESSSGDGGDDPDPSKSTTDDEEEDEDKNKSRIKKLLEYLLQKI